METGPTGATLRAMSERLLRLKSATACDREPTDHGGQERHYDGAQRGRMSRTESEKKHGQHD